MSADYDVVVVGASLAGCTTATLLGRAGDARRSGGAARSDPAAYKTICTHFIQPSATPAIERLGLAERIEAAGGVRGGVELWTRYGWVRPPLGDEFVYPALWVRHPAGEARPDGARARGRGAGRGGDCSGRR